MRRRPANQWLQRPRNSAPLSRMSSDGEERTPGTVTSLAVLLAAGCLLMAVAAALVVAHVFSEGPGGSTTFGGWFVVPVALWGILKICSLRNDWSRRWRNATDAGLLVAVAFSGALLIVWLRRGPADAELSRQLSPFISPLAILAGSTVFALLALALSPWIRTGEDENASPP